VPYLSFKCCALHLQGKYGVLLINVVGQTIKMHKGEPDEWDSDATHKKNGCGTCGTIILVLICSPLILLFIPFPETPIKTYPVDGKSYFDVLQHKVIVSLGSFDSGGGMPRRFRVWVDVPNERWGKESVTLKGSKIEYRIDGGEWRDADRTPEGDYRGGGSARIWYWSPLIQDLELLDASRKSYKLRSGRYDLKVDFEAADGTRETVETTFLLAEKTVRHWTSVQKILKELSGIN
jgi:hypothetical protein